MDIKIGIITTWYDLTPMYILWKGGGKDFQCLGENDTWVKSEWDAIRFPTKELAQQKIKTIQNIC